MGIKLYKSNRLEVLLEKLSGEIGANPLEPMTPEIVVVQSRGMARWLSLGLADRLGVAANLSCPFPDAFVSGIYSQLFLKTGQPFEKETAAWHIMRLLKDMQHKPSFSTIKNYLADNSDLKRLQLARRIADLFDQYTVYRPDLILGWDKGEGDDWQALLWRALSPCFEGPNRAVMQRICLQKIYSDNLQGVELPERLSIFGVSSLPPYYIQIFDALSRHIEIRFYLLNPCEGYWGDIVSDREMARITRRENLPGDELYLTKGNSLLAATGQLGRDFFDILDELGGVETELFEEPEDSHLLSAIQKDILHLEDRGIGPADCPKKKVDEEKYSVAIHSCHSPMREVEVLRDQLLHILESHPDVEPRDIVVMAPDIELYSPLIQAVFDAPVTNKQRIPYSIADRSLQREGEMIELFLATLKLAKSRYGVNQVRDIVGSPLVFKNFGLAEDDFNLIDRWIASSRIRWGIDDADKQSQGLPPTHENTWRFGLERLLSGYAMAGGGEHMFMDILPFDDIEGGETQILGKFIDCLTVLFEYSKKFEEKFTLNGWSEILMDIFTNFFDQQSGTDFENKRIRESVAKLAQLEKNTGFREKLEVDVVRAYLAAALEQESSPFGFISGGITFCSMLPMRAIPFKVVCLLGMNDREYPRPDKLLSFDKTAGEKRKGDRSRRLTDRYIFLEALLSARSYLYISYVGQSITDDSKLQPSVLVSELIDYIKRNYELHEVATSPCRVTNHPLQPFSHKYFSDVPGLFSYASHECKAAKILQSEQAAVPLLVNTRLEELPEEFRDIDIEQLLHFGTHPVRYFCRQRLGISVLGRQEILEEKEPFSIDGLERYLLTQSLLKKYVSGREIKDLYPLTKATGQLPHGSLGKIVFNQLSEEIYSCGQRARDMLDGEQLPSFSIDLRVGAVRLRGALGPLYEKGLLTYQCARVKGKDLVRAWIQHLILNLAAEKGLPRTSVLIGKDETCFLSPIDNAEKALDDFLALYCQGMSRPLPFLPESSLEFAAAIKKGKDPATAMERAEKKWLGNEFQKGSGEGEDIYYKLCFRDALPFNEQFVETALAVYNPLLSCLERVKA